MAAPRYARPPGSSRVGSRVRAVLPEAFLLLLALALFVGPRLLEGQTALEWTRYHAAQAPLARRPGEHTRQAGHWAAQTVDALAPLPVAAEAARLALKTGQMVEGRERLAALTLYTEVRAALARARASRWRGLGLGALADEAERLAQAARVQPPNDP